MNRNDSNGSLAQYLIPEYRPDIDGLRAVAVLSVIGFHFGFSFSNGGFIGVDVFFTISGFLITQLIVTEMATQKFSFWRFYARRIRRILPALLVVILTSIAAGYVLLLPSDLALLGQQSTFAAVGASNIYFYMNLGYFDRSAEYLPLLHTWSLGVEEQFYLIWPAIVLVAYKISKRWKFFLPGCLTAIAVASFAASTIVVDIDENFAFYMLFTRAWQLAVGGLLAVLPMLRKHPLNDVSVILGLAAVFFAVYVVSDTQPYPSWLAILPVLGASLIIITPYGSSIFGRALAIPPVRGLGLISYSLYLWHWPALVFFRIWSNGSEPEPIQSAALLLLVLALSVASYFLIEQPFRRSRTMIAPFALGVPAVAAIAGLGYFVNAEDGFMNRLPPDGQVISKYMANPEYPSNVVFCNLHARSNFESADCLTEDVDGQRVLVVGDSHAHHLMAGLAAVFPKTRFFRAASSGCRPVLEPAGKRDCVAYVEKLFDTVVQTGGFDAIVLSARWRNGEHDQIRETVDYLSQFTPRVIVLGQTIEYRTDLPAILMQAYFPRRQLGPDENQFQRIQYLREVDREMREALLDQPVEYYSVLDALCTAAECKMLTGQGVPMSWDYGHFTIEGSIELLLSLKSTGLEFVE